MDDTSRTTQSEPLTPSAPVRLDDSLEDETPCHSATSQSEHKAGKESAPQYIQRQRSTPRDGILSKSAGGDLYNTLNYSMRNSLVVSFASTETSPLLYSNNYDQLVDERNSRKKRDPSDNQRAKSIRNEILCGMFCCFGNISHGMAYGLASPAVPSLLKKGMLTLEQISSFESLLTVGALIGAFIVGFLVNVCGRRGTILLAALPFIAGWVSLAMAKDYVLLFVGRVLTGVGYGLVAVACPLYIVETVSREIRGGMTLCVSMASSSGVLIQFCLGLVLDTQWLSVVSMVPVIIMMVGMIFMPESPRWLMLKGKYDKSLKMLTWIRMADTDQVLREYNTMANTMPEQNQGACSCSCGDRSELKTAVKSIAICCFLFGFQQFSGATPIMFNSQEIFSFVGFKQEVLAGGEIAAILLAAVRLVSTILGISLIDRVGRRPLFITSGFILAASSTAVGLYFHYKSQLVDHFTWIPLTALLIHESAFAVAWGGIPWLLLAELPPASFRGLSAVAGSVATRLSSFITTESFIEMAMELGLSGTFWFYAVMSALGSIFAWIFMPETRMRTLENINHDFSQSVHLLTESVAISA